MLITMRPVSPTTYLSHTNTHQRHVRTSTAGCIDSLCSRLLLFFSIAFSDDTHSLFAIKIVYFYLSTVENGLVGGNRLEYCIGFKISLLLCMYGLSKMFEAIECAKETKWERAERWMRGKCDSRLCFCFAGYIRIGWFLYVDIFGRSKKIVYGIVVWKEIRRWSSIVFLRFI